MPRSTANCRKASITPAQSTDFGQRVEHVMHDTHFQIASLRKARCESSDLNQPHRLVRQQIHVFGHRAAGRTLAALVTIANVRLGKRVVRRC